MDHTVALVLFGMFALAITGIVVLGLYAKIDNAKVAINAIANAFGKAGKSVLPMKNGEGVQHTESTATPVDVSKVF